jgi:hypothetical protein
VWAVHGQLHDICPGHHKGVDRSISWAGFLKGRPASTRRRREYHMRSKLANRNVVGKVCIRREAA